MRYILIIILLFLQITTAAEPILLRPKYFNYQVMQKVIENGWSASDSWEKKYIEENATKYMSLFMEKVKKPIYVKTDKEYIEDALERHQTYIDENITFGTSPTIQEYKERIRQEVKHKIYYFRYDNKLSGELFQVPYLYIKYLEDANRTKEAFKIYKAIAKNFLDIYQKQGNEFFSVIIQLSDNKLFTKALMSSIQQYPYSAKQRKELHTILSKFLLDKNKFNKMLTEEKRFLSAYLSISYLRGKSAKEIIKNEVVFQKMLVAIDEDNLSSHLENIETMKKLVTQFKTHVNEIHKRIESFKTLAEYETYDQKMQQPEQYLKTKELIKLSSLFMMDDLKLNFFNRLFKYRLNEEEFIHLSVSLSSLYGKPWVWGKFKFKLEEQYEMNKKLLEKLK